MFSSSWISPKTFWPKSQTHPWPSLLPLHVNTQAPKLELSALISFATCWWVHSLCNCNGYARVFRHVVEKLVRIVTSKKQMEFAGMTIGVLEAGLNIEYRMRPVLTVPDLGHGPLTRYVKLQVAHARGMPGTFSPPTDFKGNRQLAIPACITARASRTCRDACRDR